MKKTIAILLFSLFFISWFLAPNHLAQAADIEAKIGSFEGQVAPNFELSTLEGDKVQLSDYRGKKVLLNLFATWCGPCQQEMPLLVAYDKKFDKEKTALIGVNLTSEEKSVDQIRPFLEHFGVEFTVLLDVEGDVLSKYHTIGIPTTFIINEEGVIEKRISGILTENQLNDLIE